MSLRTPAFVRRHCRSVRVFGARPGRWLIAAGLMATALAGSAAERPVAAAASAPPEAASVPAGAQQALQQGLFGVRWRVQELLGAPLGPAAGGQRAPHLILDPSHLRLSGSGGCNRLMGSFSIDGARLTFKRVVTTMMACPQGMSQERRLIETLGEVQRWHLEDHTLMLMNWQQQVLVKLVQE